MTPRRGEPDDERLVRFPLGEAVEEIDDADLLLFRRQPGLFSYGIRLVGRSDYSHAAKAVRTGGQLMCAEVREWYGGRVVTLASQVAAFPGHIDVFQANAGGRWPHYRRRGATVHMLKLAGCQYGWGHIFTVGLLRLPLLRRLSGAPADDSFQRGWPPFCSEAVAAADRLGGGVDPVPELADRLTEPGDLARSPFYQYRFTLVP